MPNYDPRWASAISSIESGGRYGITGPVTKSGDRAYGRYQVMGANIPEWTQAALGRQMTPEEYLADNAAQDAVFKHRFGGYVEKYGTPQDAASAWFTGRPINAQSSKAADVLGTTGAGYVSKFTKALGDDAGSTSNTGAAMGYADENQGALSTGATMGPGVLVPGARSAQQGPDWDKALMGVASSLAGVYSPDQARALTQQSLASQKTPADAGYTLHVDNKTGKGLRMSKDGQIVSFQAFTPKPEKDESQKGWDTSRQKANSDLMDKIDTEAASSQNALANINQLKTVLANPKVYQGAAGDQVQTLKKLANSFGLSMEGVPEADYAKSMMNQLTLGMRGFVGGMPGSLSDKDLAFLQNMGASLNNDPAANASILDNIGKVHQRSIDIQKMRDRYMDKNGVLDDGFRREVSAFAQANPLFAVPAAAPKATGARPPLGSIFSN